MKNINEKELLAETDLEEGEIPEFEICRNPESKKEEENHITTHPGDAAFGRMKDSLPVRIPNPNQSSLIKNSIYFPSEKGRYELLPADGDNMSEKSKSIMRNQVPQNPFYDYKIMERRLKYLHPFQTTYGSVEHIMTKIGETLGRSNDSCYKRARSNDPIRLIKSHNKIGATFKESDSFFRRLRNGYQKRRRYSESNPDSERKTWETRLKSRNSTDLRRREEKDFKKKRKSKFMESIPANSGTKKYKPPEETVDDLGSNKSKFLGNERILRAIRELQRRECETTEVLSTDEDSKPVPEASTSLGEKDGELPSSGTVNSDDNQENRNYQDFSEKSLNNEDSDDDVELIRLRLLALTSNKKKGQGLGDEKLNDVEEKIDENPLGEFTEDEKESENQVPDDVTCKINHDNDIDRYELILRAEALKTALLKKHERTIKKHKNSNKVRHDEGGNITEQQELITSQEGETETRNEENSMPNDTDDSVNASVSVIKVSQDDDISESPENRLVNSENDAEKCIDSNREIYEKNNKNIGNCLKAGNVLWGKMRKRRLKKGRKFSGLNLNELNIKENSGVTEEDDKKAKIVLPDVSHKRGFKEYEKFVLVDSSQLSKLQSMEEPKLDLEQGCKNPVPVKPNDLTSFSSMSKITETESQRIIVHLGSDSSDEESPAHNQSRKGASPSPKETENLEPTCPAIGDPHSRIVYYEKSVELLLKDARRRIERNLEASQRIPPTPEAVYNHLAPSQRLEYIRLKQKIAETEKLRKVKGYETSESPKKNQLKNFKNRACPISEFQTNELSTNKVSSSSENLFSETDCKDPGLVAGRSSNPPCTFKNGKKSKINLRITPVGVSREDGLNEIKQQKERNLKTKSATKNFSDGKLLSRNGNSANVVKNILERKKTLTQNRLHLERLKMFWKKIKMEKMIEDKCKYELKRLKIRQNFLELKVSQQRAKIRKLADESKQIYEAFQRMNRGLEILDKRKKSFLIEKNCSENKVESGGFTLKCPDGEIVDHVDISAEPKKEEGNLVEKIDGTVNLEEEEKPKSVDASLSEKLVNASDQLKEYNSPLQRPSTGSESLTQQRVDPNTIMCQYDLTGRCNDEECPFQHLRS